MPVRTYGEPYAYKFFAIDIFVVEISPVIRDSVGDINFYQMSLSQSELFNMKVKYL